MILIASIAILLAGILAFWFLILRPVIRSRHFADAFFDKEESLWQALAGYRTMLLSWGIVFAGILVQAYDFLVPIIVGTDVTPVLNLLPSWAWPIIWIGIGALFRWLRAITTEPEPATAPVIGKAE